VKPLEEEANEEMQPQSVVFKEPEMVKIPTGNYEMDVESDNKEIEHVVNVIPSFEIGKYEVTQGLWMSVMGVYENPSVFSNCGENCPVENVNWTEVQEFIRRLNIRTGKHYRLPTELEWEYACRGGTQNRYCGSDDVDLVSWHSGNSGNQTHPVGQKQKNRFGLYDMSGNVWEWVDGKDVVDNNLRILRGGSFLFKPLRVHVADRNLNDPSAPGIDFGFRLAISQ
jgi:formylglycine-generating enzyme required for sulfatase activity